MMDELHRLIGDGESPNLQLIAEKFGIDIEDLRAKYSKRSQNSLTGTLGNE